MKIDPKASAPCVAFLTEVRDRLAALVGDRSICVRLEVNGERAVEWSVYTSTAGKFARASDLACCVLEQVRLDDTAARAQRKRQEADDLIREAAALEAAAT